ncbi:MAG: hypothetical protein V7731_07860 [Amphritea sp.]
MKNSELIIDSGNASYINNAYWINQAKSLRSEMLAASFKAAIQWFSELKNRFDSSRSLGSPLEH